jgi:hypothetical protein
VTSTAGTTATETTDTTGTTVTQTIVEESAINSIMVSEGDDIVSSALDITGSVPAFGQQYQCIHVSVIFILI